MLKIVRASVLILTLAGAASAGDGPNNVTDDPTRQPTPILLQEPTGDAGHFQGMPADGFGETLLNLFNSVLALF